MGAVKQTLSLAVEQHARDRLARESEAQLHGMWVVIPAYNEGKMVGEVVANLVTLGLQVVVVDDGSADNTQAVAKSAGAIVLRHVTNRGQGAALQTGIDFVLGQKASVVVTFDADGQHSAEDIPALVATVRDEGADVALGSRFLGKMHGAGLGRTIFLRLSTFVSNRLSGLPLTDSHCGIRAISASALRDLRITQDGMAHASQLLYSIARHRLSWKEVPVTIRYTEYSRAKGQNVTQSLRILFDYFFHRSRGGQP